MYIGHNLTRSCMYKRAYVVNNALFKTGIKPDWSDYLAGHRDTSLFTRVALMPHDVTVDGSIVWQGSFNNVTIIIIFGLCPNILILQRNFTYYSWHVCVRRYFSLNFYLINMTFGHGIPRVLRYYAMTFLSRTSCSSGFIRDSLDPYRQKAVSAHL